MAQLLSNKIDIEAWLQKYHVRDYSLKESQKYGWVVISHDNVKLRKAIVGGQIRVKFESIEGSFDVAENGLTSLLGCPEVVNGFFDCSENKLTDLSFCPKLVSQDFYCDYNKLESLKGAPMQIGGAFICDNNNLTSLEHCPQYVRRGFVCADNFINTVEFLPVSTSEFVCKNNPALGGLQGTYDFEHAVRAREEFLEIKNNKIELEKSILVVGANRDSKIKKI